MTEKRNKSLHGKLRYHQSACAVETLLGDISVAKSFGVSAGHQLCFKSTAWRYSFLHLCWKVSDVCFLRICHGFLAEIG